MQAHCLGLDPGVCCGSRCTFPFGLTTYPCSVILRSNVYPRRKRAARTLAGNAGPADPTHTDLWITAWTRDRTCHPADFGRRTFGGTWCPLSRATATGRARLDLCEMGYFFQ